MNPTKTCTNCHEELPLSKFPSGNRKCNSCRVLATRVNAERKRNRERSRLLAWPVVR